LAQRLRAGKIVGLICDRDVTGGGIEVEFFGEKARMMGGAPALAVQTGAALMPAILWFEGDGWGVNIHEEIPVPAEGDSMQKAAAMMQEVARHRDRPRPCTDPPKIRPGQPDQRIRTPPDPTRTRRSPTESYFRAAQGRATRQYCPVST
jgi:hypothetical protein